MEEKIKYKRPRPFSSGFIVPFSDEKGTVTMCLQCTQLEIVSSRRVIVHVPQTSAEHKQLHDLDDFCLRLLKKNNKAWFRNEMDELTIETSYARSLSSNNFLSLRCNAGTPPKTMMIGNDEYTDWIMFKETIDSLKDDISYYYIELYAPGIWIQKQSCSLLWRVKSINALRLFDLAEETNVDHEKEEIEGYWKEEIEDYSNQVDREIKALEDAIRGKKARIDLLNRTFNNLSELSTNNAEWNNSISSIQGQLRKHKV